MDFKVITANRLRDGDVVYLTATGEWSEWLDDSVVFEDQESEAALMRAAERAVSARAVVAPYAAPVDVEEGRIIPRGQRETIRARGPTVRPDLGKQAAGKNIASKGRLTCTDTTSSTPRWSPSGSSSFAAR